MIRLLLLFDVGVKHVNSIRAILALIHYLNIQHTETRPVNTMQLHVSQRAEALVPTCFGELTMKVYRDCKAVVEHLALIGPNTPLGSHQPTVVRVHTECLTVEAFGSLKCECGAQ